MSSNIIVRRICEQCSREFIARTTVTKYCSKTCSKKAYKDRIKAEKIQNSNIETARIKEKPMDLLKAKEFLNINEVSQLLGISRRTIYRLIGAGELNIIKVGTRTILKRAELDKFLNQSGTSKPLNSEPQKQIAKIDIDQMDMEDYYSVTEVQSKYGISEKGLHSIIKRNKIPKIRRGWYSYVPKTEIDNILN
jgi:excisionase family DNA binding protein